MAPVPGLLGRLIAELPDAYTFSGLRMHSSQPCDTRWSSRELHLCHNCARKDPAARLAFALHEIDRLLRRSQRNVKRWTPEEDRARAAALLTRHRVLASDPSSLGSSFFGDIELLSDTEVLALGVDLRVRDFLLAEQNRFIADLSTEASAPDVLAIVEARTIIDRASGVEDSARSLTRHKGEKWRTGGCFDVVHELAVAEKFHLRGGTTVMALPRYAAAALRAPHVDLPYDPAVRQLMIHQAISRARQRGIHITSELLAEDLFLAQTVSV